MIVLLQLYGQFKIGDLCTLFGVSRQAYYFQQQAATATTDKGAEASFILGLVKEYRKELPFTGVSKLYEKLNSKAIEHGIKLGRDGWYKLLADHGMLIRRRKKHRKATTTDSNHPYIKYPNLIKDLVLNAAGLLWVSDITYLRVGNGFNYLNIITDAYSHKIVGYKLHPTLHAQGSLDALAMAGKDIKKKDKLIHHSDRGVQYCCTDYIAAIKQMGIQPSMTENGDPYENAIAERVNGILKTEMGLAVNFANHTEAKKEVDSAIRRYNELRMHDSCDRLTPIVAHEETGKLKVRWKAKKYPKKSSKVASAGTDNGKTVP